MKVGWNEWGGGTLLAVENENWLAEIALVPGGCPVRLLEKRTATEVFRTPANMAALRKEPAVYGMPVLLPPNRIAGGRFQAAGREYRLPVNEPEKGNHLHGLLLNRPWELERETPEGVTLLCRFGEDQPEYAGFPHAFEARRSFEFLPGLFRHRFELVNRSGQAMPFGLGFHTTFRLPEVEEAFVEIPFREEGAGRSIRSGGCLRGNSGRGAERSLRFSAGSVPPGRERLRRCFRCRRERRDTGRSFGGTDGGSSMNSIFSIATWPAGTVAAARDSSASNR